MDGHLFEIHMAIQERDVRTQPARCSECGTIFVAGVTQKGAYIMGNEHCTCGSNEFELITAEGSTPEEAQ